MFADPEQMRFFPAPRTPEQSRDWLERNIAVEEAHGFGVWCLESRADGGFVGYSGLRPIVIDGTSEVELAWHLHKARWNRGLATEAARASLELGFDRFGLPRLVATIPPEHLASRRVAEKLGMTEERTAILDGETLVVYAI